MKRCPQTEMRKKIFIGHFFVVCYSLSAYIATNYQIIGTTQYWAAIKIFQVRAETKSALYLLEVAEHK